MRTSSPPLLPIFRSRLQGDLLAVLLPHPSREYSLSDLARMTGGSVAAVQREANRLESAGILGSRRSGRSRLLRADLDSPFHAPLARLVTAAFGPPQVLAEEFGSVGGVSEAHIFGSWVSRYEGEEGPPPADIDVLLIGSPDRDHAHDAALRAERRLGIPVNVTIRSARAWEERSEGFTRHVWESPRLPLPGVGAATRERA